MKDCIHTTVHKEKKEQAQGIAQCLNMWRKEHGNKHPGKSKVADIIKNIASILSR